MYKCEIHGKKDFDWCDECGAILACDCTDIISVFIKDIHYLTKTEESNITIKLVYCTTCGKIIEMKRG